MTNGISGENVSTGILRQITAGLPCALSVTLRGWSHHSGPNPLVGGNVPFPDGWLHIKNWEKFQYRSDKKLPWIRLDCALLQDRDFLKFDRATQRDLIAIWLLARNQSHAGWIPDDNHLVSKLIQGGRNLDLQVFVNTGFLEKKCALQDRTGQDKTEHPPICPPLDAKPAKAKKQKHDYTEDFLKVWTAYPRQDGKWPAFRAFEKAKIDGNLQVLIDSIEWHKQTDQWKRDGIIPHLSTYLNQRRWEDGEDIPF